MSGLTLKPYNARLASKPRKAELIGPFTIRHLDGRARLRIYLQPLSKASLSWRHKGSQYAPAYARGVVEAAMSAIWGPAGYSSEFSVNDMWWRIAKVRVIAPSAPHRDVA